MRVMLGLLALLLLAPSILASDDTGLWWPGDTVITVRDFTNPKALHRMVASRLSLWAPLLQGGTTVNYVREAHTSCAVLLGSSMSYERLASLVPPSEIWVCSQRRIPGRAGAAGEAWVGRDSDGRITNALLRLRETKVGDRKYRLGVVCHELGHAFGVQHSKSKKSCVAARHKQPAPGSWDAATLVASFGG